MVYLCAHRTQCMHSPFPMWSGTVRCTYLYFRFNSKCMAAWIDLADEFIIIPLGWFVQRNVHARAHACTAFFFPECFDVCRSHAIVIFLTNIIISVRFHSSSSWSRNQTTWTKHETEPHEMNLYFEEKKALLIKSLMDFFKKKWISEIDGKCLHKKTTTDNKNSNNL